MRRLHGGLAHLCRIAVELAKSQSACNQQEGDPLFPADRKYLDTIHNGVVYSGIGNRQCYSEIRSEFVIRLTARSVG